MYKMIGFFLAAALGPQLVQAEDHGLGTWSNLQRLQAGQRIEVVDGKLRTHRGEYAASGAEELTIQTSAGPLVLGRDNVLRVSLRENSKRMRNALIGAAIGGGAAIAIGVIADRRFSNEGKDHFATAIAAPAGLGAGAAIGAVSGRFETIYRADVKTAVSDAAGH